MAKDSIKNLTLSAMFLAMGIVLPFFIGQIPQIGSMLLPMHIPVFLCALICGWRYGVPIAVILPILRSVLFGRPNMYPEAIAIAFEMAAYAFVAGFLYSHSRWQCIKALYKCLFTSMIVGRIIRGVVQLTLLGINGAVFTFKTFFFGVVLYGIPGIVLQLVLIPTIMVICHRTKMVRFKRKKQLFKI